MERVRTVLAPASKVDVPGTGRSPGWTSTPRTTRRVLCFEL
jgi:hypothetical protein